MCFERLEQFFADSAAFPAQGIVHPDAVAADINPAAPLQVGQGGAIQWIGGAPALPLGRRRTVLLPIAAAE